jgi:hypothetical protein
MFLGALAAAAALVMYSAVGSAQAAKVDLTGKWTFNVQTDQGGGTPTMTFKQDGEKLTGKYSGQFGEADLAGSVKGNAFNFKISADAQGQALTMTYQGTIESKDSLKGSLDIAGLAQGTFTAKRQ